MAVTSTECIGWTAATALIVVTAFWRWRKRTFRVFKDQGIPGPEPDIISGNFHRFWNKDMIKVMDEWSKTYGDIYGMFHGDAPFLVVKDLDLLRRVFITDFELFSERGEVWRMLMVKPALRNLITFAKGHYWKFARSSISKALTVSRLRSMVTEMSEAVDRFLDILETRCRAAADGEADVFPMLAALTFDIISETACGLTLDVQYKPNDDYFASARSMMMNVIESVYQRAGQFFSGIKGLLPVTLFLETKFSQEPLFALVQKAELIVTERAKDPSLARPDVIQSLLDATVPPELLSDRNLRARRDDKGNLSMHLGDVAANVAAVLVAGFETGSAASASCIYFLAKYPEVQERVRREVNAAYEKHGKFSYDALSELPYTTQTIFETLRLCQPVVGITARRASCEFRYKDFTLPKGLNIMACTQDIHMDPRIWKRPEEFDPNRFSPEQVSSRDPLAFQPFGIGPRNCVGRRLAQVEVTLIVAKLLHRFRLHLGSRNKNGTLQRKAESIVVSPKNGVYVRIENIS
ncbi:cytochrome P450 6B5-like [Haemaphysalis longicornis]